MSSNKFLGQSSVKTSLNKNFGVKKKEKKSPNWMLLGFGLSAIAVISATAGALLAFSFTKSPLSHANLTPEEEAVFNKDGTITYNSLQVPELTRPVNILVLGVKVLTSDLTRKPDRDLGYHALVNSFHGLADTMLLVRFDPIKNKVSLLSIPRDTKTYIEGHGVEKINEANYLGGPALAAKTVGDLLDGVEVDRYVRINVQGIEKLIDAIGGVDVHVPKDMKYTDHSQHLYINLKQGQQHLNGDEAIQFLRFRYDNYGDIGRVQRQQMLMRAVIEQAVNPRTIVKIPQILSVIHSHIDTNLTTNELMALGVFAGKKSRSDIKMLMLPGDFNKPEENEPSYWLPNHRKIGEVMAKHFDVSEDRLYASYQADGQNGQNVKQIDSTRLKIFIQDSTDNPEAVEAMATYLRDLGYRKVYVSRRDYTRPLINTRIVAQNGDDASAAQVRVNLGVGEVLVESTGILGSDITIQLGQDWIQNELIRQNYPSSQFKTTSY